MPTSTAAPIAAAAMTMRPTLLTIPDPRLFGSQHRLNARERRTRAGSTGGFWQASLKSPVPSGCPMTRKLFVTTALPYANGNVPHRPHHGVHPGRHLGAVPAHAGPRGALRLRRRRARRADHDRGREGRQDAAGSSSPRSPPAASPTSTASTSRFDNWHSTDGAGEPRAGAGDLPRLRKDELIATQDDRAVLRPGEEHVPARPLHQGRMPELRRQGPVRRQLRGLRRGLRADRPEEPVLGAVRRDAGAEEQRALLLPAVATRAASTS